MVLKFFSKNSDMHFALIFTHIDSSATWVLWEDSSLQAWNLGSWLLSLRKCPLSLENVQIYDNGRDVDSFSNMRRTIAHDSCVGSDSFNVSLYCFDVDACTSLAQTTRHVNLMWWLFLISHFYFEWYVTRFCCKEWPPNRHMLHCEWTMCSDYMHHFRLASQLRVYVIT